MKTIWQMKKLGEVCIIKPAKSEARNKIKDDDLVSFVPMEDLGIFTKNLSLTKERKLKEVINGYTYFSDGDVLLAKITPCFENGKIGIARNLTNVVGFGSSEYIVFRPNSDLIPGFLFYFLFDDDFRREGKKSMSGAAGHKRVSKGFIENYQIPIPSLPDQQRIVKVLDEVFEGIEKIKANIEKNIQNSKELFESYLQSVFANPGKDWEEKRFDEICILQRGFDLPTRLRNRGDHPLVSSNGITDRVNLWKIKAPGVVTGRSGTIGSVHYIEEDYWPLNTALYIKEFHGNYERFVYYFLRQFDLGKYSSGAGVPTLNRNNVHGEKVWFPKSLSEQKTIVAKLDALSTETKKLEAVYRKKLADLEELKKSVLRKAFNGEL